MISKKAKYAIKAMLFLTGKYRAQESVLSTEIAEKEAIPKKFLEAILSELKRKGMLLSRKGKGGGYILAKEPSQISFGEVIRIFEDPFALLPCLTRPVDYKCEDCRQTAVCGVRMVMHEVYCAASNILNISTFQEVHDRMRRGQPDTMYFI